MAHRVERLSSLIRRELSDLLRVHVNDPRLASFISVTRVEVTSDLKNATVYVSILGDEAQKKEMLKGFEAAHGFLRRELTRRLTIRKAPELIFKQDESIEQAARVFQIMDQIGKESPDKT
jgi:ribosome-binding factor A